MKNLGYVRKLRITDVLDMLKYLVHIPSLFRRHSHLLKDTCFRIDIPYNPEDSVNELPLLYLWQGLCLYYSRVEDVAPTEESLIGCVEEILRISEQDSYLEDALLNPDPTLGFIAYIYAEPGLDYSVGTTLVQDFLRERVLLPELQSVLTVQDRVQRDITKGLKKAAETASRIETSGKFYDAQDIFPSEDYYQTLSEEPECRTTGIEFIDTAMGGGQRVGECNAILGATGAGKTMLAVMLAVESARQSYREGVQGRRPEITLYYTYEQSATDIWPRFISYGAQIARSSVAISRDSEEGILMPSRDPAVPKDYEREVWPDLSTRKSEWDRFTELKEQLRGILFIRNFSGVPDRGDSPEMADLKRNMGLTGVSAIYEDAKRISESLGTSIRSIYIDYAKLVCQRDLSVNSQDSWQAYQALASLGNDCRMLLAGRLNCTVWLCHQLSGTANSKPPTTKPTSADSDSCRSFVVNMSNAFTIGTPDGSLKTSGGPCMWLVCTKHRFAGCTEGSEGLIIQHDAHFWQLNDVSHRMCAFPGKRIFIDREEGVGAFALS